MTLVKVAEATHATFLAGTQAMAFSWPYCYSLTNDYITITDVSDPLNPVVVGAYNDANFSPSRMIVADGNICVAAYANNTFIVLDVTNPASPSLIGFYTPESASGVVTPLWLEDDLLYLVTTPSGDDRFRIVDMSSPASPTSVGTFVNGNLNSTADVQGLKDGDHLYLGSRTGHALLTIDVTNPASPSLADVELGPTAIGVQFTDGVAKVDDVVALGSVIEDRVFTFDASTPASPVYSGVVASGTTLNGPQRLAGSQQKPVVYVAARNGDAVTAVDVSNPAAPAVLESLATGVQVPHEIFVHDRYLFVGCSSAVVVIDSSYERTTGWVVGAVAIGGA